MIDRRPETLLAAEVLFRGLDTDMAEQELNLFQFTRNVAEIGSGRKFPDYVPDDFLSNPGAPYCAVFGDTPE